ncbi:MAG: hypothetical protein HQL24_01555 [Candidatus Omnitrophica bacterium]|nr:hypothetical protein [Candidatus Omnitrophota bacterium]
MIIFFILIIFSLGGIGFIFANLKKEESPGKEPPTLLKTPEPSKPSALLDKKPVVKESAQEIDVLLSQFNFNIGKKKSTLSQEENFSSEKDATIKDNLGTASLKTAPADESLSLPNNTTEEKYKKMDQLLQEKNKTLETLEQGLNSELRNRQDFDKVKTLLTEELETAKQKTKKAQDGLSAVFKENQEYKEQIAELKQRLNYLEKNLLEKDQEVEELLKRLKQDQQNSFASPINQQTQRPPKIEKSEDIILTEVNPQRTSEEIKLSELNLIDITQDSPRTILPSADIVPIDIGQSNADNSRPDIQEESSQDKIIQFHEEDAQKNPKTLIPKKKTGLTKKDIEYVFPEDGFLKLNPDIAENDEEGKIL